MNLRDFDPDRFLAEYWQKKPLLMRGGLAGWDNPLDPDELAGLALESDVESRLVVEQPGGALAVEHGPLDAARFDNLGTSGWTLLVQGVDRLVPQVAALIEPFRFLPDWRIDDVMVSFATQGGGVGAHFDNYDVFLVQGLGRRRWRIGQACDETTTLEPHDDLRLLADFQAAEEWVLEPGDILYVPPGIAHEGTGIGTDCMTYSVGFRAPSVTELLSDYCDHLIETTTDDARYGDPDLARQANPGEIAPAALERLHAMVTQRLQDRAEFARWFGEFASTPKHGAPEGSYNGAMLLDAAMQGAPVVRNSASRFAFFGRDDAALTLFADGRSYACTGLAGEFAEHICAAGCGQIDIALVQDEAARALLLSLLEHGSLVIEDDA